MALWDGRFTGETDEAVRGISESISYDQRLYAEDIAGSKAHVRMLATTRIIPQNDADKIIAELDNILQEIENGDFIFDRNLEDIHMNIEARLIKKLGAIGARVHTARSRNDQVATDIRLYLRRECEAVQKQIHHLQQALVATGKRHKTVILPGFTHLQHAQPVLLRTTCSPMWKCSVATGNASQIAGSVSTACPSVPERWPAPRCPLIGNKSPAN